MEKIINISFEQGNITSSGNETSDYRIRSGYVRLNPNSSVTVTAVSGAGKDLQVDLLGYSDETSTSPLFNKNWYNLPYTFNILQYAKLQYVRIVLKNKDGSKISPSDIADCAISLFFDWYSDGNEIKCENMPSAPSKAMVKPYPASLWRIDYLSPNMPYHRLFPNIKGINMWSLPPENVIRVYDYREKQDGFKHNGLAILTPSECTSTHELNGRWDVELTHPLDNWGRWKHLLPQNVLKINGQLFRIDELTSISGKNGSYIQVHAFHISYDLADEFVHYCWVDGLNGIQLYTALKGACLSDADHYEKYNFQFNSDIQDTTGQLEIKDKNFLETLIGNGDSLVTLLGGELYRDNFYLSINSRMENAKDNAFALKYGFDMVGITQKVNYSDWSTWLMCDDNFGNFFAVSYTDKLYPIHHHKHTFKRFNYSVNDWDRLVKDTNSLFKTLYQPKVSYEVDVATVAKNDKYNAFTAMQDYRLGDKGVIECDLLGIRTTQEIISIQKNEITGEYLKIKLGNETNSIIRPSYRSNITSNVSPSESALQKQVQDLQFNDYIDSPVTTIEGEYLTTSNNQYLMYKR